MLHKRVGANKISNYTYKKWIRCLVQFTILTH